MLGNDLIASSIWPLRTHDIVVTQRPIALQHEIGIVVGRKVAVWPIGDDSASGLRGTSSAKRMQIKPAFAASAIIPKVPDVDWP